MIQFRDRRVQTIQQLQQNPGVAVLPRELAETTLVAAVRVPATAFSYSAVLRLMPRLAVDS